MAEHDADLELPREPIHRLVAPFERFLHVEASSGIVLLVATVSALVLANSPFADSFAALWRTEIGLHIGSFETDHSLRHWINDGLMVIFFFVIGLEVKRELVVGELRDLRVATLPIAAAIGGMVVPAGLFVALQWNEPARAAWGIPMATDIAFVVGALALLGDRVPKGFRVFIVSLAIVDDIGAILVIALGYTASIEWSWLAVGAAAIGALTVMQRLGVRSLLVYTSLGLFIWLSFHESGVHATLAGVILGVLTPARAYLSRSMVGKIAARAGDLLHGDFTPGSGSVRDARAFQLAARESVSPLEYLEDLLHPWVSFVVVPIFAFANAGVRFQFSDFADPLALAVAAGLVVGKPVGIFVFSWMAVRAGIASLPEGCRWSSVVGGGMLCGIGFTMALFVAGLALEGHPLEAAKVGVLGASTVAAVIGMAILARALPKQPG